MASNNLRIIYQNAADLSTSTLAASSTASVSTTIANIRSDIKSLLWRSGAGKQQRILLTSTIPLDIGGIILPFCNLTPTATIRVRGFSSVTGAVATYNGVGGTGALFDTGVVVASPYPALSLWDWGTNPLGSNVYAYGGGTYGRVWLSTQITGCYSIAIDIDDTSNTNNYIEVSRLFIGKYWSPKYNTSYGLSTTMKDLSSHERSEAGDLVTNRGVRHNSMNFDMNWLVKEDQLEMQKILRGNGISKSMVISLFPDNTDDYSKEQSHQICGKLSDISSLTHPVLGMYSTSISIDEL
jgi:hypothetical protein